jgi:hypothetical protein
MSIGSVIGILTGGLISPSNAGPNPITVDDLVPILDDIDYRFSIIADAFAAADRSAQQSVTAATDAATQLEEVGQNVKDITERTYTVVIPHSLSWLAGYLVSHFITPLEERVGKLESTVAFILGWRNQIDTWRHAFVDPNVEKWIGFHEFFVGWPQAVLFRWHDYFDNPSHFAEWATPPLVGPIVAYLAASEHRTSRDNLARIMVDAWDEVPNDVWISILKWSVTTK